MVPSSLRKCLMDLSNFFLKKSDFIEYSYSVSSIHIHIISYRVFKISIKNHQQIHIYQSNIQVSVRITKMESQNFETTMIQQIITAAIVLEVSNFQGITHPSSGDHVHQKPTEPKAAGFKPEHKTCWDEAGEPQCTKDGVFKDSPSSCHHQPAVSIIDPKKFDFAKHNKGVYEVAGRIDFNARKKADAVDNEINFLYRKAFLTNQLVRNHYRQKCQQRREQEKQHQPLEKQRQQEPPQKIETSADTPTVKVRDTEEELTFKAITPEKKGKRSLVSKFCGTLKNLFKKQSAAKKEVEEITSITSVETIISLDLDGEVIKEKNPTEEAIFKGWRGTPSKLAGRVQKKTKDERIVKIKIGRRWRRAKIIPFAAPPAEKSLE